MIIIIIVIIITITTVMIMIKKEIQKHSTANSSFCLRQLYSWWVALNTMTNLGAYNTVSNIVLNTPLAIRIKFTVWLTKICKILNSIFDKN